MVSIAPTSLAPGFRFHPTDEELVRYYLRRKICGKPFRLDAISEIDIYKTEPWDLPCMSKLKTRDLEWYFFSVLDKKYGNGSRTNRATENGYWKTTGKDRAVLHRSQVVGMKKTLVYHFGRAPRGQRTNWVMHEYRLIDEALDKAGFIQDSFVLCRVFQKSGPGPKNGEQYGAPLIEEEWEDDEFEVFLKEEAASTVMEVGDDAYLDENDIDQILGAEVQPESAVFAPTSTESIDNESQKFLISLEDYTCEEKQQQLPDDYFQKLLDKSEAYDYVTEQLEDKAPYGFEVDKKHVRHEHLEDPELLDDMAPYGFQADKKQVRNEHLEDQELLDDMTLYGFQADKKQVVHERLDDQEHLENKALYGFQVDKKQVSYEHLEDQEHLDDMSLYDFQCDKHEYIGEPSNKEALVLEDTDLKNGEQYVDATDDFDSYLGAFLESDDLMNPINVDDSLGFDMLEEYLNFSDANDGMSDYITFDDPSLVGGELPISQDLKEELIQPIVSSEQSPEHRDKQQMPSNYGTVFEQHPFMKQASQMLLGNVHAPPAFASEFPDGALLKFQSPASSSAHVTMGMMEIRNSSQVGHGSSSDMFHGKKGLCKIIVSFGMSRGDDNSTTLESVVRILPGKAVSGVFGGGCFYLMLLSILVVSLSFKMGCLIFTQ